MRKNILFLLLLSGCASQPQVITTEQIDIDRSQLKHLASDDVSMWIPKKVPPPYPSRALSSGTEGCANVEFIVDSDGRPKNARVVKSSPAGVFDKVALSTVAKFTFSPSAANPQREAVITNNTFTFFMMNGKSYAQAAAECSLNN